MYSICVCAKDGRALARAEGARGASLLYKGEYQEGDYAVFAAPVTRARVRVDARVETARVYLPEGAFKYVFPLAPDDLRAYAPGAFSGGAHLLSIEEDDARGRRELAENPADQRIDSGAYPHATANVETRGESVFCARNTIDGLFIANGHGNWPYESWGIGAREDACLTLDFGRDVKLDEIVLFLRADFPHDAYWIQGTLAFDAGEEITFPLEGADGPQRIAFPPRVTRRVRLYRLIKCDMPSAFPSLRQIRAYGCEADA